MVAIHPDWSDPSDLCGHVDLNGKFVLGAITNCVKQAKIDCFCPHFLCLDEMNLAHVEYYLSDVLSVIETRNFVAGKIRFRLLVPDTYYGNDTIATGKYETVCLPKNLYIIGTVNIDETTFPVSYKDKVLDRTNTIESLYVDLMPNFEAFSIKIPQSMNLNNVFLKTEYLMLNEYVSEGEAINAYCLELQGAWKKMASLPIGTASYNCNYRKDRWHDPANQPLL